jgi:hypothetical protein
MITCPNCSKQSKGPADLAGRKLKCKTCSHIFTVGKPAAPKPRPAAKRAGEEPPVARLAEEETVASKKAQAEEATVVTVADEVKSPRSGKAPIPEAPKEEPLLAIAIEDDQKEDDPGYVVTDIEQTSRCPYCAIDMEDPTSVVCLHCGYNTQTRQRMELKRTVEHTSGEKFMWLLPGIACAATTLFMLTAILLFWTWFPKLEIDFKEEGTSFLYGMGTRIWGSVFALFIAYFTTRFAIHRLMYDNVPPENVRI